MLNLQTDKQDGYAVKWTKEKWSQPANATLKRLSEGQQTQQSKQNDRWLRKHEKVKGHQAVCPHTLVPTNPLEVGTPYVSRMRGWRGMLFIPDGGNSDVICIAWNSHLSWPCIDFCAFHANDFHTFIHFCTPDIHETKLVQLISHKVHIVQTLCLSTIQVRHLTILKWLKWHKRVLAKYDFMQYSDEVC